MTVPHGVVEVQEQTKTRDQIIKTPGLFQVFLFNDDYTPMDFVVQVLQRFFGLEHMQAERIMWQVHTQGKGLCGIYTRDIAETKAAQVNSHARQHEHPLLCDIERL